MNETLSRFINSAGIPAGEHQWVHIAMTLVVLALIVVLANVLCRRLLIPLVKGLVSRTRSVWDDVLFNDTLLLDVSHLVSPILIAVLLPIAFAQGGEVLEFFFKVNTIYLIVVVAKLLCSFLSTLYEFSNRQDSLKNQPLKGVYQMLKIMVVCVALIIVVSVLI